MLNTLLEILEDVTRRWLVPVVEVEAGTTTEVVGWQQQLREGYGEARAR